MYFQSTALFTISFLFFTLLVFAQDSPAPCYFPNGDEDTRGRHPCGSTLNGSVSACCYDDEACSESGFCYGNWGFLYRGSCTDQTWTSNNCPSQCRSVNIESTCNLLTCATGNQTFCCDDGDDGSCRSNPDNIFSVDPGNPFYNVEKLASISQSVIAAASTSSVSSSSVATSAIATPTVTVTACDNPSSPHSSSSPSPTTVGLGVGIPLGVLLVASLLFLFYRERHFRRLAPIRSNPVASSEMDHSPYMHQPYESAGIQYSRVKQDGSRASELNSDEIRGHELDGQP